MENTETVIRTIKLQRRRVSPIDLIPIGFISFGFIFLLINMVMSEIVVFDLVIEIVFSILLIWLGYRFYKSLLTTETYRVGVDFIEVEKIFKGKSRITTLSKEKIQSIELKPLGFLSFYTKTIDFMLVFRIFASFGLYYVPFIDCGSSYLLFAEYYDRRTRKWITNEIRKELNYSP